MLIPMRNKRLSIDGHIQIPIHVAITRGQSSKTNVSFQLKRGRGGICFENRIGFHDITVRLETLMVTSLSD